MKVSLHLDARAKDVDAWARGAAPSTLVKSNNGRDVWLVAAGKPGLYVKRFPRELLRDRAVQEAELLRALEKARIPCPKLVATAHDRKGSYVLTEEIAGARPLGELLREPGPRGRALVRDFGLLARRLHDAGVDHQDFHAGNVLVRGADLFVIDVHRAALKKLSHSKRLDAVAFAAMSFVETRPRSDVLRFFRAYGLVKPGDQLDAWRRLRERHHEYYLGRQKRAFKDGTGFGVKDDLHFRKGIDLDAVLAKVKTGKRESIRKTRSETLDRVDKTLFVKTTRPSRAKRIWANAHALAVRGIDTPALWAWEGDWVAGEWVPSCDLHEYVQRMFFGLCLRDRKAFLFRLARIVRRLHDTGVYHSDLKAGNVLVGDGRILVIDLDRVRFSLDVSEVDRIFNLAQLNAAVLPPLTKTDRLRFLDYYIGPCASLRKLRTQWIRGVMHVTVSRRHRWPPRKS